MMVTKYRKHRLAYGFWLNRIVSYFNIERGLEKAGSVKQVFYMTTLEDNECIPRRGSAKSIIIDLIDVQIG